MTPPRVAPMVRRMAMSRPLSFTSMVRPEMMFSAATSTISVRMMNMTLRSIFSASKKLLLRSRQSVMIIGRPTTALELAAHLVHIVGLVDQDLDDARLIVLVEEGLRLVSGMKTKRLSNSEMPILKIATTG